MAAARTPPAGKARSRPNADLQKVLLIEDSVRYQNLVSLVMRQQFPELQLSVAEARAPPGLRPALLKPLDIDALRDAVRRTARSREGVSALLCGVAAGARARRIEQADAQHGGVIWPVLRNALQWYVLQAGSDASSACRPPLRHLPAS